MDISSASFRWGSAVWPGSWKVDAESLARGRFPAGSGLLTIEGGPATGGAESWQGPPNPGRCTASGQGVLFMEVGDGDHGRVILNE